MTRDELIAQLRIIRDRQSTVKADGRRIYRDQSDIEGDHDEADRLLIAFINDPEVSAVWDDIVRWYGQRTANRQRQQLARPMTANVVRYRRTFSASMGRGQAVGWWQRQ